MAFDFNNFGDTPETKVNQQKTGFDFNSFGEQSKQVEKPDATGFGSSIPNFGKDISQGLYLAFGQKNIDDTTKQYLDNAATLTNLSLKQDNPEAKKKYITMAQGMIDDAKKVGGNIIGKTRTSKQIIADALGTLGWTLSAGTPTFKVGSVIPTLGKVSSNVASRIAMGTAVGAGAGAQGALNENKSSADIAKETAIGGAIGLGVSGAVEAIGAGLRKLVQTKPVRNFIGNVYNRELQPDTKDLAKSIERHATTIGQDIANSVDDAGKPIYMGGYDKMGRQAQNQIKVNAQVLRRELANITTPTYTEQFKKPLLEKLTDEFGALDTNQLNTIENEINKLPAELNPTQVLDVRQLIDKKIPSNFWIDPNPQRGFIGNVRYTLRTLLKDRIEELAPTDVARTLNKKIGLAIDVKDLAFLQEALRAKGKGTSSIGLWKYISTLLDRTVFSPSVTTRVSQTIKKAGQMSGSVAGRNAITKGIIENSK